MALIHMLETNENYKTTSQYSNHLLVLPSKAALDLFPPGERERERVRAAKDVMRKHIRRKVNRTEAAETS